MKYLSKILYKHIFTGASKKVTNLINSILFIFSQLQIPIILKKMKIFKPFWEIISPNNFTICMVSELHSNSFYTNRYKNFHILLSPSLFLLRQTYRVFYLWRLSIIVSYSIALQYLEKFGKDKKINILQIKYICLRHRLFYLENTFLIFLTNVKKIIYKR